MFRALTFTSSGAQDYICVIAAYGVWCLGCWWSAVRSRAAGYASGMREIVHNFPHPRCIACCSASNSWPTKASHTTCGNNTSILSSSWWWTYKCPKHAEQIIFFFFNWHYNPWWVSACFTISFHNPLYLHVSLQFLTFLFFKSSSTCVAQIISAIKHSVACSWYSSLRLINDVFSCCFFANPSYLMCKQTHVLLRSLPHCSSIYNTISWYGPLKLSVKT